MSRRPFFTVNVHPDKWQPPPDRTDYSASGPSFTKSDAAVVSIKPWQHPGFVLGGVSVVGRKAWGASDPVWQNQVVYYNTKRMPLASTLNRIVIHHTNNSSSVSEVESKQKRRGYAALGYHFFIDKSGVIYEGRPLEVMGSHAGEGIFRGPAHDPDWGAIGITLQGDYHHADDLFWHSKAPKKLLQSLETLIVALKSRYAIDRLLMHREVVRKGKKTVCPGDHLAEQVVRLRKKLKMSGPTK